MIATQTRTPQTALRAVLCGLLVLAFCAGCSASSTIEAVNQTAPPADTEPADTEPADTEPADTAQADTSTVDVEQTPAARPDEERSSVESRQGDAPTQERSEAAVRQTFEAYRSALLVLDGEAAARVVNQATFAYYDRVLDAGLNATPDELLESIPLSDALGVLVMRAKLGEGLASLADGFELFVIGVEQGLVGDSVGTLQFDRIDIDGDEAFGIVQGQQVMRFEFVESAWYLDLPFTTSILDEFEEDFVRSVTGGSTDRAEMYDVLAFQYGTTWGELSMPVR